MVEHYPGGIGGVRSNRTISTTMYKAGLGMNCNYHMMGTQTKKCSGCKEIKSIDENFGLRSDGYRRCYCHQCNNLKLKESRLRLGDNTPARVNLKQRANIKRRMKRQLKEYRAKFIVEDAKKSDKKKGLECDLTIEFVDHLIKDGCQYCGDTEGLIGLDRIDNNLGHLQQNVVPCCSRCNYIRRDMPHEAWVVLATALKPIRESGLFGEWVGGIKKKS